MAMNDDFKQHDEKLKKWLKQVHEDVVIPDGTQSWLEVKARLDKIKKRKRLIYRIKVGSLVACTSLIISLIISSDLPTAYSQFQSLVKQVKEDIVNIFFDDPESQMEPSPEAKTMPPPSDIGSNPTESLWQDTTLEEAQGKVSFHIAVPTYTPKGYSLDIVRTYQDADGEYRSVFMEYVNEEGRIIQLNQRMLHDDSSLEMTTVDTDSGVIKDIRIHDDVGVMITYNNDFIHVEWLTADNIKFTLFGLLPEKEIMLMAESLQ